MTQREHELIVESVLRESLARNLAPADAARAIVARVREELGAGAAESPRPAAAPAYIDHLAPPAPSAEPESSVVPASAIEVRPLRLNPRASRRDGPERHYTPQQLRGLVAEHMPETLKVEVPGRSQAVVLQRQIDMLPGLDLVRVSYQLGFENNASPSKGPNRQGELLQPMAVDTGIIATFGCYDQDLEFDQKLRIILDAAVASYRPRPEHIAARTVARRPSMGFAADDPHEEV